MPVFAALILEQGQAGAGLNEGLEWNPALLSRLIERNLILHFQDNMNDALQEEVRNNIFSVANTST